MNLSERVLAKVESMMSGWDDCPSNNDRFCDGEEIVALIRILCAALEADRASFQFIQNTYHEGKEYPSVHHIDAINRSVIAGSRLDDLKNSKYFNLSGIQEKRIPSDGKL